MAKVTPISEHFQHFLAEMMSFWGGLYGQTKLAWQKFFELRSGNGTAFRAGGGMNGGGASDGIIATATTSGTS